MAFVLSDYEFERICERSELTCGHNCRTCEAFQANQRYHNWDEEEDEDDDLILEEELELELFLLFELLFLSSLFLLFLSLSLLSLP